MKVPYPVFFCTLFLIAACTKKGTTPVTPLPPLTVAEFSLVSNNGNCIDYYVQGVYAAGVALDANNKVYLRVNVTVPGKYSVVTTTMHGVYFADSGIFTTTGIQNVVLKGNGTIEMAGLKVFPVTAGNSSCSFEIIIIGDPSPDDDNDHMLFGNLSNAADIADSVNNYLMRKTYYSVSYSRDRGIPNWVSWHLYSNDLGNAARQNDFRPDNTLPAGWYQVPSNAYSGSGFDRGHNLPSADRTITTAANSATFLMTNMIPQAPDNNQQTWASMEDSLRRLVSAGNELYVMMGNYGAGGTGDNGYATTIHNGQVTVPAFIWKVAVVLPNGNNDTSRVTVNTRMIAVLVPNINSVNTNWKNYRTSIDVIENATGYDLLKRLPVSLQGVVEGKVDNL